MRIGMIGLGRMGANMVRRLQKGGHECVAYDHNAGNVKAVAEFGARGVSSPAELVKALAAPRVVWIMVPAAVVDVVIDDLRPVLSSGDVLIDGGNSNYRDDIRRAENTQFGSEVQLREVHSLHLLIGVDKTSFAIARYTFFPSTSPSVPFSEKPKVIPARER